MILILLLTGTFAVYAMDVPKDVIVPNKSMGESFANLSLDEIINNIFIQLHTRTAQSVIDELKTTLPNELFKRVSQKFCDLYGWRYSCSSPLCESKLPCDHIFSLALARDGSFAIANSLFEVHMITKSGDCKQLYKTLERNCIVKVVAVSPHNKYIAIGNEDGSLILYDNVQFKNIRCQGAVTAVCFSDDEQYVLFGTKQSDVCLLNIKTGSYIGKKFSDDYVNSVALSGDNSFAVISYNDIFRHKDKTYVCDFATLAISKAFTGRSSALSHDNRLLATGGFEGVNIWDLTIGERVRRFRGFDKVKFLSANRILIGEIEPTIWDATQGTMLRRFRLPSDDCMPAWDLSLDNTWFASAVDNTIYWWHMNPFEKILEQIAVECTSAFNTQTLKEKALNMASTLMARDLLYKSPDLVKQSFKNQLRKNNLCLDVKARYCSRFGWLSQCTPTCTRIAHTPCASQYLLSKKANILVTFPIDVPNINMFNLTIWDYITGKQMHECTLPAQIICGALSEDGSYVAVGCQDNNAYVMDVPTGKLLYTFDHSFPITALAISDDDAFIVTGGHGLVRVWDLKSGECKRILSGHPSTWINKLFISEKHNCIVSSAGYGHGVCVWEYNSKNDRPKYVLEGSLNAFSPDKSLIVNEGNEKSVWSNRINVWNVITGQHVLKIPNKYNSFFNCAISPDNRVLVTVPHGDYPRMWDLQTGSKLCKLYCNDIQSPGSVAFNPQGQLIAVEANNRTNLYHVPTGNLLHELGNCYNPTFSSDGQFLFTANSNHDVLKWQPEIADKL